MDSQDSNKKVCFEETLDKMVAQNIIVDKWDRYNQEFVKTIIQIKFTNEQQIIYQQDGLILRMQIKGGCKSSEIMNNMEQIYHLFFQGQYEQNERKSGRWRATWDGEVIRNNGGYYEKGLKQGFWKELNKNYCRQQSLGHFYNYLKLNENIRQNHYYQTKYEFRFIVKIQSFKNKQNIFEKDKYPKSYSCYLYIQYNFQFLLKSAYSLKIHLLGLLLKKNVQFGLTIEELDYSSPEEKGLVCGTGPCLSQENDSPKVLSGQGLVSTYKLVWLQLSQKEAVKMRGFQRSIRGGLFYNLESISTCLGSGNQKKLSFGKGIIGW